MISEEVNTFETAVDYFDEVEDIKELTPQMLRNFVASYEQKFPCGKYGIEGNTDNEFTKDRLICYEILSKRLKEEKEVLENFIMKKLPDYLKFPEEARKYTTVKNLSISSVEVYGETWFHGEFDESYGLIIPTEFFLDPDGAAKRKEFFKVEKQKQAEKLLEEERNAVTKREAYERELLAELQEKYKNNS